MTARGIRTQHREAIVRFLSTLGEEDDVELLASLVVGGDSALLRKLAAASLGRTRLPSAIGKLEELACMPTLAAWVRQQMGVVGERLVLELQGLSCLGLEEVSPAKKNVCCAKSFGHPLTEFEDVMEALACYVARASEKVRAQKSVASAMQVFLMTNPHRPDEPQHCPAWTATLIEPTAYTPGLIATAREILQRIFLPGYRYRKVGILLLELRDVSQLPLFGRIERVEAKARLQAAVDQLDGRVRWGAMGFAEDWGLRAKNRSSRFTTAWRELPVAHAGAPPGDENRRGRDSQRGG